MLGIGAYELWRYKHSVHNSSHGSQCVCICPCSWAMESWDRKMGRYIKHIRRSDWGFSGPTGNVPLLACIWNSPDWETYSILWMCLVLLYFQSWSKNMAPVGGVGSSAEGVRCSHRESHWGILGQETELRSMSEWKKTKRRGEMLSSLGPQALRVLNVE